MLSRFGTIKSLVVLAALAAAPAFGAQKILTVVQTDLGALFADENGLTLYTFDLDQPGQSHCSDACAVRWPPALVAEDAAFAAPFSVVTRADGAKQLAYKDQPLYRYAPDMVLGDTRGDGVGGVWHVVKLP